MTTKPTKPHRSLAKVFAENWTSLSADERAEDGRLQDERWFSIIEYLDEQHAAGRGEPKMVLGGFGAPGYGMQPAPATPETGERAESTCHHHRYTQDCPQCAFAPIAEPRFTGHDYVKAKAAASPEPAPGSRVLHYPDAPIAEPPSPVAGEPTADMWTEACAEALRYKGERDEARSQLASERAAHEVTRGQMETLEKEREGLAVRLSHVRLIVRRTLASGQLEKLDDAKPYLSMLDTESAREAATPSSMRRAAWLEGQAVGVEDTLRVIMLDRGAKFASHFRPIDSDLTKYPEDIPASPSESAPVAEPAQPACNCMWPVAPIGPDHSGQCPMCYVPTASADEGRGE